MKGQDSLQNPTWQEVLDEGVRVLSQAGIAEAQLDAWYLFSESFPIDSPFSHGQEQAHAQRNI